MKYIDEKCEILENKQIAQDTFDLTVKSDFIAKNASCGQFANILCGDKMLRRPISICDTGDNTVRFVYQVKGGGTKWLSEQKVGTMLEVFGPLGNGFEMPKDAQKITLIGGGIGTPPMLKTLKTAKEKGVDVKVGNVVSSDVFYKEDHMGYVKKWQKMGVLCEEMESAALYLNAARAGKRGLCVCTITDDMITGEGISSMDRQTKLDEMITLVLDTVVKFSEK
mgnify:CR=1 FL=1